MQKRGVLDLQFNWIFILIAGGVLLIFFVGIITSANKASDTQLSADVLQHLDTVLKNAVQASSTGSEAFRQIALPATSLILTCSGEYSSLRVGREGLEQPLPEMVVFSPSTLEGDRLYTWTRNFDLPFRTQSFLYMATGDTLFVFLGTNEQGYDPIRGLFDAFPQNYSARYLAGGAATVPDNLPIFEGYDAVKFISINYDHPEAINLPGLKHATYINIVPDGDTLAAYGTVEFYTYTGARMQPAGEAPYIGESLLYGALFSEDLESYNCNLDKAFARAERVATIIFNRVQRLDQEATPDCRPLYVLPESIGEEYLPALQSKDMALLYSDSTRLQRYNQDLTRGAGCPLIY